MTKKKSKSGGASSSAGKAGKAGKSAAPAGAGRSRLQATAPWAARHAAKHAAEAQRRNSTPAPPGSARATLREPAEAAQLKQDVAELHQRVTRIRSLSKQLAANFFEVGALLAQIRDEQLFSAKGYASFDAFVERETDLGKSRALALARVPGTFLPEAAQSYGLNAVLAAISALDANAQKPPALPLKPPRR